VQESVEWKCALSDHVGIYEVTQLHGPENATVTADFTLEKPLRGNPPKTFSRKGLFRKPEDMGFLQNNTYVFFFVDQQMDRQLRSLIQTMDDRYFMSDHVWLQRQNKDTRSMAIDHRGKILEGREAILNAIDVGLNTPRAHPEIDRLAYYYRDDSNRSPHTKDYNYKIIPFPSASTGIWLRTKDCLGLVIPA